MGRLPIVFMMAASAIVGSAGAKAATTTGSVLATDNIYLSGQIGSGGGTVPSFVVSTFGGDIFRFAVTGSVILNNGSGTNTNDPDGIGAAPSTSSNNGAGSIAGLTAPNAGYLVGVFAPAGGFSGQAAPSPLNFTSGAGTSFASLSPSIGQVFFIGDGRTGDGAGSVQQFIAPTGAGKLYLGISDAGGYNGDPGAYGDNSGSFSVVATDGSVLGAPGPIAGAGLVPLLGLAGAYLFGRRKNAVT